MGNRYLWTAVSIASIWLSIALISIFAPTYSTDAGQTQIPIVAVVAAIFGMVATIVVAIAGNRS